MTKTRIVEKKTEVIREEPVIIEKEKVVHKEPVIVEREKPTVIIETHD